MSVPGKHDTCKEIRVPRNSQRCICERKGQNDAALSPIERNTVHTFTKPGSGLISSKWKAQMHTSDTPLESSTLCKHPENC